ncbi:STAS/SEC14 domain-containing protein [Pseudomaricurvus sp.]|uniref:STAS/SEC14 domain-containing protein n=1 Tax=Pseudomaricurvus sp. TaxID=2004510 RepID=UPI003F6A9A40
MLDFDLDPNEGILRVSPASPMLVRDFAQLSEVVDRYLSNHECLNGIIINTDKFPGWEDFSALVSHLKFVRDHHKQVRKVAAVSDDSLIKILPPIAQHFVAAEIRQFDGNQLQAAYDWIRQPTE